MHYVTSVCVCLCVCLCVFGSEVIRWQGGYKGQLVKNNPKDL